MKLINIGYGNMVNSQKVVSVVSPDAAPIKRLIQDMRDALKLIDVYKRQIALPAYAARATGGVISATIPK